MFCLEIFSQILSIVYTINLFLLIPDDPHFEEEKINRSSLLEKNLQSVYVKSEGDVSI